MDPQTLEADFPALPPPPGQTPNFDNPSSKVGVFTTLSATFAAVAFCFVSLRTFSRLWVSRTFSRDDYASVVALAFLIGYVVVAINVAAEHGIGVHMYDVGAVAITPPLLQKLLYLQVGYLLAILFTKLSLFWMYLRVFSPNIRTRYLIHFGTVIVVLFYIACLLVLIISWTPRREETWMQAVNSNDAGRNLVLTYVMAAFNVVSDFYILVLPLPVVWRLQMPMRRKVGIYGVLMTGFMACTCSVISTYYRVRGAQSPDVTWHLMPSILTAIIEIAVGIMVGCMPHTASVCRQQIARVSAWVSASSLVSKILNPWFRKSKHTSGEPSDQFGHLSSTPQKELRLETGILGSVRGQGEFLDSNIHRQWTTKTACDTPS